MRCAPPAPLLTNVVRTQNGPWPSPSFATSWIQLFFYSRHFHLPGSSATCDFSQVDLCGYETPYRDSMIVWQRMSGSDLAEQLQYSLGMEEMGITSDYGVHDDVTKWKHFPRYWPFVRGIHRGPVNSPHKGQWRGALMLTLICARINGWVNNREAGDLRRYRPHCDVIVMLNMQSYDDF